MHDLQVSVDSRIKFSALLFNRACDKPAMEGQSLRDSLGDVKGVEDEMVQQDTNRSLITDDSSESCGWTSFFFGNWLEEQDSAC